MAKSDYELGKDFFVPEEFDTRTKVAYAAGATCALGSLVLRLKMLYEDGAWDEETDNLIREQFMVVRQQIQDSVPASVYRDIAIRKAKEAIKNGGNE